MTGFKVSFSRFQEDSEVFQGLLGRFRGLLRGSMGLSRHSGELQGGLKAFMAVARDIRGNAGA